MSMSMSTLISTQNISQREKACTTCTFTIHGTPALSFT
uniref:Uncharacterized protein n=1 Tax=Rhizophora mucronata TaxID=61149 RepID=A0A2P2MNW2_RHIMU